MQTWKEETPEALVWEDSQDLQKMTTSAEAITRRRNNATRNNRHHRRRRPSSLSPNPEGVAKDFHDDNCNKVFSPFSDTSKVGGWLRNKLVSDTTATTNTNSHSHNNNNKSRHSRSSHDSSFNGNRSMTMEDLLLTSPARSHCLPDDAGTGSNTNKSKRMHEDSRTASLTHISSRSSIGMSSRTFLSMHSSLPSSTSLQQAKNNDAVSQKQARATNERTAPPGIKKILSRRLSSSGRERSMRLSPEPAKRKSKSLFQHLVSPTRRGGDKNRNNRGSSSKASVSASLYASLPDLPLEVPSKHKRRAHSLETKEKGQKAAELVAEVTERTQRSFELNFDNEAVKAKTGDALHSSSQRTEVSERGRQGSCIFSRDYLEQEVQHLQSRGRSKTHRSKPIYDETEFPLKKQAAKATKPVGSTTTALHDHPMVITVHSRNQSPRSKSRHKKKSKKGKKKSARSSSLPPSVEQHELTVDEFLDLYKTLSNLGQHGPTTAAKPSTAGNTLAQSMPSINWDPSPVPKKKKVAKKKKIRKEAESGQQKKRPSSTGPVAASARTRSESKSKRTGTRSKVPHNSAPKPSTSVPPTSTKSHLPVATPQHPRRSKSPPSPRKRSIKMNLSARESSHSAQTAPVTLIKQKQQVRERACKTKESSQRQRRSASRNLGVSLPNMKTVDLNTLKPERDEPAAPKSPSGRSKRVSKSRRRRSSLPSEGLSEWIEATNATDASQFSPKNVAHKSVGMSSSAHKKKSVKRSSTAFMTVITSAPASPAKSSKVRQKRASLSHLEDLESSSQPRDLREVVSPALPKKKAVQPTKQASSRVAKDGEGESDKNKSVHGKRGAAKAPRLSTTWLDTGMLETSCESLASLREDVGSVRRFLQSKPHVNEAAWHESGSSFVLSQATLSQRLLRHFDKLVTHFTQISDELDCLYDSHATSSETHVAMVHTQNAVSQFFMPILRSSFTQLHPVIEEFWNDDPRETIIEDFLFQVAVLLKMLASEFKIQLADRSVTPYNFYSSTPCSRAIFVTLFELLKLDTAMISSLSGRLAGTASFQFSDMLVSAWIAAGHQDQVAALEKSFLLPLGEEGLPRTRKIFHQVLMSCSLPNQSLSPKTIAMLEKYFHPVSTENWVAIFH